MTKKTISDGISNISTRYIEEAANYSVKKKSRQYVRIKLGAMAACLCFVALGAFAIIYPWEMGGTPVPNPNSTIEREPESDEYPSTNIVPGFMLDEPNGDTTPTTSQIHINMSNIVMNQIEDFISADYAKYNPATDNEVIWNKEDIIAYYGTDLVPAYIPNSLSASTENNKAIVYIGQDGSVVEDTVYLRFYNAKSTEGFVRQGFFITVSKIGIVNDCIYLLPENEVKVSDIGGTAVSFGYRSMPYGPYDSDTHEPSGYYDMYVAEFKLNDVEYQIVAKQMAADEVVKVVSSIICGEETIIDE